MKATLEEKTVFRAKDLLSKWGFGDGNMLAEHHRAASVANDEGGWCVLADCVRYFLGPALPAGIELEEVQGTAHNPIRAAFGTDGRKLAGLEVTVATVEVVRYIRETVARYEGQKSG